MGGAASAALFFGAIGKGREKINAERAEDAEVAEKRQPSDRETRQGERKGGRHDAVVEILQRCWSHRFRMTTAGRVG